MAFAAPLYEGYGLTETCAIVAISPDDARTPGHVGAPAPCIEIKLKDVEDMNYRSENQEGEVGVRLWLIAWVPSFTSCTTSSFLIYRCL